MTLRSKEESAAAVLGCYIGMLVFEKLLKKDEVWINEVKDNLNEVKDNLKEIISKGKDEKYGVC